MSAQKHEVIEVERQALARLMLNQPSKQDQVANLFCLFKPNPPAKTP